MLIYLLIMKNNFTIIIADQKGPGAHFKLLPQSENITCLYATNAGEALLLGANNPDADMVLISSDLEGMAEFDTVKELVTQFNDRPVILLCTYVNLSTIRLAGILGCSDVLKAPIDSYSLRSILNSYTV
jgi:DNA-binding NtrC family response regulator